MPNHLKAEGHHREEVPGHIHLSIDWSIVLLDIDYEVIARARKLREGQGNDSSGYGLGCEEVVDAVAEAADNATVSDGTNNAASDNLQAAIRRRKTTISTPTTVAPSESPTTTAPSLPSPATVTEPRGPSHPLLQSPHLSPRVAE